jgi:hypothetical protein
VTDRPAGRPSESDILVCAEQLYDVVSYLVEDQDTPEGCDLCGATLLVPGMDHYEDCIVLVAKSALAKVRGTS